MAQVVQVQVIEPVSMEAVMLRFFSKLFTWKHRSVRLSALSSRYPGGAKGTDKLLQRCLADMSAHLAAWMALYAPETLRSPPPLVVSLLIDLRLWKKSLMVVNKGLSDFSSQSMSSVSLFSMASASPSVKVGTGSGVPSLHVSSSPTETEIKYRDGLT